MEGEEGAGGFTIDSDAHSAGRQLGSPASVGTITQTIHVGGHSCHRARAPTAMLKNIIHGLLYVIHFINEHLL